MPNPIQTWLLAARPKTLLAGACPVIIGSVLAYMEGAFYLPAALAALLGAMCIQIGTNFCNDYFDFKQGADTEERQGPTRAVQAGLISGKAMLTATIFMFALAAACVAYLYTRVPGPPILIIGLISILCGIWYTAGRFSIGYLGLGDIFVLIFFGPVAVGGTFYVQAMGWNYWIGIASLPPGLLATAILVVNNLRDVDQDRAASKNTLAVRFGRRFVRVEYLLCLLGAAIIPLLLMLYGWGWWLGACPLILIPGFILFRTVCKETSGAKLNPVLGKTAGLLLLYTLIFSIAYLQG
ncbi:MAG: 1,4-dihydroxy-2-naphthoate octaprenyltransferase [Kiritimatiellia bacterium]|jgi:1,4-dihydroxy-2-naphthoate polyprenyltransferase